MQFSVDRRIKTEARHILKMQNLLQQYDRQNKTLNRQVLDLLAENRTLKLESAHTRLATNKEIGWLARQNDRETKIYEMRQKYLHDDVNIKEKQQNKSPKTNEKNNKIYSQTQSPTQIHQAISSQAQKYSPNQAYLLQTGSVYVSQNKGTSRVGIYQQTKNSANIGQSTSRFGQKSPDNTNRQQNRTQSKSLQKSKSPNKFSIVKVQKPQEQLFQVEQPIAESSIPISKQRLSSQINQMPRQHYIMRSAARKKRSSVSSISRAQSQHKIAPSPKIDASSSLNKLQSSPFLAQKTLGRSANIIQHLKSKDSGDKKRRKFIEVTSMSHMDAKLDHKQGCC